MRLLMDGKIKEQETTSIDGGYFYGYGLFETLRIKEGRPIFLGEHLKRLNAGLKKIGLHKTISPEEILEAVDKLQIHDGAFKINVSEAHTLCSTRGIPYEPKDYERGARLQITPMLRNPTSPTVGLKTMNYMDNLLALRGAKAEGFDDVLFLNPGKEVCETAVANIFFVQGEMLITPAKASGLLPGIVRGWVMERRAVVARRVQFSELAAMEGAFITNSLMGIMRVAAIGENTFQPHPVIASLEADYAKLLAENGL